MVLIESGPPSMILLAHCRILWYPSFGHYVYILWLLFLSVITTNGLLIKIGTCNSYSSQKKKKKIKDLDLDIFHYHSFLKQTTSKQCDTLEMQAAAKQISCQQYISNGDTFKMANPKGLSSYWELRRRWLEGLKLKAVVMMQT